MTDHELDTSTQTELFDAKATRSLLDRLFDESRLYKQGSDYKELLDFVVRLRNFAPFNAMLLQVQKPGLSFAASARDWRDRFGRRPKEGARPLLILWPFSPVALVYDYLDTEGRALPEDVAAFTAKGSIDSTKLNSFKPKLSAKNIEWLEVDTGDNHAGLIRVVERPMDESGYTCYRMHINRNHETAVQFTTLAHELGHLFLGHLGPDRKLGIPQRSVVPYGRREVEAESVAYIVCERNGVRSKSQKYLSAFVGKKTVTEAIDVYQVMRAAGKVETVLGLESQTRFDVRAGMA